MKLRLKVVFLLFLLPGCFFKKSSRKFDCVRATYESVLYRYEPEMNLLDKIGKSQDHEEILYLGKELKEEILLRHEEYGDSHSSYRWFARRDEYTNYPFSQYKNQIDCDIELLEDTQRNLYWKQEGLGKSIQDLINRLDSLRRRVVLSPDYEQERRMMERREILKLEKKSEQKSARSHKKKNQIEEKQQ